MNKTDTARRVALYALGCAKNQVDAEQMLGGLVAAGYEVTTDPASAGVLIVNTCGFLAAAREEALATIRTAARQKLDGACETLVVSGCMAQILPDVVRAECPEVDLVVGVSTFDRLPCLLAERRGEALEARVEVAAPEWTYPEWLPRHRSTPPWTAYIKIGEGCDCNCAFCLIPTIRGALRSRPRAEVVREARALAAEGVREVILIGEDTTGYGADRGRREIADLIRDLGQVEGLDWVRLMYAYPTKIDAALIAALAESPNALPYLDMPLQHASHPILRAMGRGGHAQSYLALLERLRAALPHLCVRSTFIVGFPGERRGEFEELRDFLAAAQLDRVGFFPYSPEAGTRSADLPGAARPGVVAARIAELAELQASISAARLQGLVGQRLTVLVEQTGPDGAAGRSYRDAPEIDGLVRLTWAEGQTPPSLGSLVEVRIEGADEHDMWGSWAGEQR